MEGRKGGKVWFGVESKSFEISIKEIRGKVEGRVSKRGRGFSSWIKFGEKSLSWLLEEVESCCNRKVAPPFPRCGRKRRELIFLSYRTVVQAL